MDSPDILSSYPNSNDSETVHIPSRTTSEEYGDLQEQVIANFQKPNLPNVNVPERIVICLDVCFDNHNSLYRLGDGTTFTPINMLKRVLDFFIHSKHAINKSTEFALIVLKEDEPIWAQNFTNHLKDIFNTIDYINTDTTGDSLDSVNTAENFDFSKVFQLVKENVEIPEYKQGECIMPPPYIVRMLVIYGRSNCIPIIPQEDPYFISLKKQVFFYMDILYAHEEDCAMYKCEDIYDALQDLDDGYSYVFEVSRNATKIHDCIAKLLAHPLQRSLQKNTDYSFGSCVNRYKQK